MIVHVKVNRRKEITFKVSFSKKFESLKIISNIYVLNSNQFIFL